jgi:hypothetical protein
LIAGEALQICPGSATSYSADCTLPNKKVSFGQLRTAQSLEIFLLEAVDFPGE